LLSAVKRMEDHPIKKMFEAGVRLSIGTDDLLFFNRSVSEQCADLVDAGVLTQEQIFKILDDFER
ncbi:MAG: adenosine deaminase, partial [Spirochaetaceae bacterium]|nr:adenosine deaminase [Spirochaetaceae bacterium]